MLFTKGKYKHETGFEIMVTENGDILISPDHPLSLRLSEIFDKNKWTKVEQEGYNMAVRNKEEILEAIKTRVGEQTDDGQSKYNEIETTLPATTQTGS